MVQSKQAKNELCAFHTEEHLLLLNGENEKERNNKIFKNTVYKYTTKLGGKQDERVKSFVYRCRITIDIGQWNNKKG